MNEPHAFPLLIAIETDATLYHGEHARRPAVLARGEAEQLLAHLAADLGELLPRVRQCRLVMPGAVYDQTQLLRPGYPVYRDLMRCSENREADEAFQPHLLSIGANDGQMPSPNLQPDPAIEPAVLQLLPLLIRCEPNNRPDWFEDMEHVFIEHGQVSPRTAQALESGFGIIARHARFMTLTDLMALLHMQLEHFGFLPLWELLDAALNDEPGELTLKGRQGVCLRWRDGTAQVEFETFDYWATEGGGTDLSGDEASLVEAYCAWTREYRQYLLTLRAHRVRVRHVLPGAPRRELDSPFFVETRPLDAPGNAARVTEHSAPELGALAVSVLDQGRLMNYYPLEANGLNAIHEAIREAGHASGGVSFAGRVCCSAKHRGLRPDSID